MLKKILISIVCMILIITICIFISKDRQQEDTTETVSNFEEETIIEKTWQEDAAEHQITVFMNRYRYYPIKDLYTEINNYSNQPEYENNIFFEKYIEEYNKMDLNNLNEKQLEFVSTYSTLQFNEKFDKDKSTIENIWSFNYNSDGSLDKKFKEDLSSPQRGFIIKVDIDGEKYFIKVSSEYSYYGYTKTYYTKCYSTVLNEQDFKEVHGVLDEKGGTLNGRESRLVDPSGVTCVSENKEDYINLIKKYSEFYNFIKEYADIYWKHYSETVQSVNLNEKTKPKVGMTKSEVIATDWGYPNKKNIDTYSWGTTEQWVYNEGYVYFKDDIVTSVSER